MANAATHEGKNIDDKELLCSMFIFSSSKTTDNLVCKFDSKRPDEVAVYHSQFPDYYRFFSNNGKKNGEIDDLTRVAIFLELNNFDNNDSYGTLCISLKISPPPFNNGQQCKAESTE